MKTMKFLTVFLFLTIQIFGAHYYVAITGSDANTGTSTSSPWLSWQKVVSYANSTHFQSGDIISFRCGDRFLVTTQWTNGSVSLSNLTLNSYVNGNGITRPIIDGQHTSSIISWNGAGSHTISNITFNGIKFSRGLSNNITLWSCTYIDFESCNIDSAYQTSYAPAAPGMIYIGGTSPDITSNHITISNSTISYSRYGHGFYCNNVQNVLMEHDTVQYNGAQGLQFVSSGNEMLGNVVVRYCVIRQNATYGASEAGILDDGSRDSKYYYNVIENNSSSTYSSGLIITNTYSTPPKNNYYCNNTFIIHGDGNAGIYLKIDDGIAITGLDSLYIKNNIVYCDNNTLYAEYIDGAIGSHCQITNDFYYSPAGNSNLFHYVSSNYAGTTAGLNSWQLAHGYDASSIFANPSFTVAVSDLSLQTGSPCINTGINLSSQIPQTDILGNPISDGYPDIGAYEKQSAITYVTLTLSVSPSGGGTVMGAGTYQSGSGATITAITNTNYTFTEWDKIIGSGIGDTVIADDILADYTNPSSELTMSASYSLVAKFTYNAPTTPKVYYLSTTGTGGGTSWADKKAYTSFDFTTLNGGDSVYFDGGSSGLTYGNDSLASVNPSSQVVFTKGKDAGHNGKVTWTNSTPNTDCVLHLLSCSNIKITDMTFYWNITNGIYSNNMTVYLDACQNMIVNNCHIISNGYAWGLDLGTCLNVTVSNDTIETQQNTQLGGQDPIFIGADTTKDNGGYTITGNVFIHRGEASGIDASHKDLIQMAWIGSSTNYQTVIANNYFYYMDYNAQVTAHAINMEYCHSQRFLIYNNVFAVRTGAGLDVIHIDKAHPSYKVSLRVYNNTICEGRLGFPFSIGKSSEVLGGHTMAGGTVDTLIIKNNIVTDSARAMYLFKDHPLTEIAYMDIDYNHYKFLDSSTVYHMLWANSTGGSVVGAGYFGDWQTPANTNGFTFDAHSDTSAISFANLWGSNLVDYKLTVGSAGIDQGITIPLVTTDIIGTQRGLCGDQGCTKGATYDMGAFEYVPTSTQYSLTVQSMPLMGGSTYPSGTDYYAVGRVIPFEATPNTGYVFSKWTLSDGSLLSAVNNFNYTVTGNAVILAQFLSNVPQLIYPGSSSSLINQPLMFNAQWTATAGASTYIIEFSTHSDFTGGYAFYSTSSTNTVTVTLYPPLLDTQYFWRVSADGGTTWSVVKSFASLTCH